MSGNLSAKEEAYCQGIAKYGRKEKVKAYKEAGYSQSMSPAAIQVQADKLYNKPKLALRIDELTEVAEAVAEKEFGITLEKRLAWLEEIVEAGLYIHKDDADKLIKRENLNASVAAIKTLNEMLGTGEEDETGETLSINFTVSEAVKTVKVTNAKT